MPEFVELPPVTVKPISLVLLAREAEAHLADVVQGWREVLDARLLPFEIVLVDDGSSDRTAAVAGELPDVKLLRHEQPRGLGAAMRTGLAATTHPLIVLALCDPAYRPSDLGRFLASMDRVHFLSGFRAARPVPLAARAVGLCWRVLCRLLFAYTPPRLPGWLGRRGHLASLVARIVFGVRLRDVGCPYRVFRREILARSPIQSDGEFALVEQLAKVNFAGFYFGEEEVTLAIEPRPSGSRRQSLREGYRVFARPDFGKPDGEPAGKSP